MKKNYREVNCCGNCGHCFHKSSMAVPTTLYCTYGAPKRPLCGNYNERHVMFFGELTDHWDKLSKAEQGKLKKKKDRIFWRRSNAWEKWSKGREVACDRICDYYKNMKG